jgi:hypothetical protein
MITKGADSCVLEKHTRFRKQVQKISKLWQFFDFAKKYSQMKFVIQDSCTSMLKNTKT